jgi:hypothetical protein
LLNGDTLIKKGSLSGDRLRNHTVTGKQINLGKLGKVPNARQADSAIRATDATGATNATNAINATNAANATTATNASHATAADTVGGPTPSRFSVKVATSSGPQTMIDLAGLMLTLSCNSSGNPVITVTNDSASMAEIRFVKVLVNTATELGNAALPRATH